MSRVGTPAYEATVELAEKLGRDVVELPGGHLGFVSHPAAFARELVQPLARTGRDRSGDALATTIYGRCDLLPTICLDWLVMLWR